MSTPSVPVPNDPSGRVQLIPAPLAAPGQCGMCGKAEHPKGFIDIRMDFEFFGVLYFCFDCASYIAAAVGFYSPHDLAELRECVDKQNDELAILREAVLGLESEVDGLLKYTERIKRNSSDLPPVIIPDDPSPDQGDGPGIEDRSEPQGPPPLPPGERDAAIRRADQPVNEPGPDDLLNLDESNALLGIDES